MKPGIDLHTENVRWGLQNEVRDDIPTVCGGGHVRLRLRQQINGTGKTYILEVGGVMSPGATNDCRHNILSEGRSTQRIDKTRGLRTH